MSYLLGAEATDPAAEVYGPPRWTTNRLEFSEEHCILPESSASQAFLEMRQLSPDASVALRAVARTI